MAKNQPLAGINFIDQVSVFFKDDFAFAFHGWGEFSPWDADIDGQNRPFLDPRSIGDSCLIHAVNSSLDGILTVILGVI